MDSLCPVHHPGRRYLISQLPTKVPHMWDMCPISTNHLLGCWQHWRHTLILMKTQSGLSHLKWPKCWSRRVEDMTKTSSSFWSFWLLVYTAQFRQEELHWVVLKRHEDIFFFCPSGVVLSHKEKKKNKQITRDTLRLCRDWCGPLKSRGRIRLGAEFV